MNMSFVVLGFWFQLSKRCSVCGALCPRPFGKNKKAKCYSFSNATNMAYREPRNLERSQCFFKSKSTIHFGFFNNSFLMHQLCEPLTMCFLAVCLKMQHRCFSGRVRMKMTRISLSTLRPIAIDSHINYLYAEMTGLQCFHSEKCSWK